jgi:hypothetical protein
MKRWVSTCRTNQKRLCERNAWSHILIGSNSWNHSDSLKRMDVWSRFVAGKRYIRIKSQFIRNIVALDMCTYLDCSKRSIAGSNAVLVAFSVYVCTWNIIYIYYIYITVYTIDIYVCMIDIALKTEGSDQRSRKPVFSPKHKRDFKTRAKDAKERVLWKTFLMEYMAYFGGGGPGHTGLRGWLEKSQSALPNISFNRAGNLERARY